MKRKNLKQMAGLCVCVMLAASACGSENTQTAATASEPALTAEAASESTQSAESEVESKQTAEAAAESKQTAEAAAESAQSAELPGETEASEELPAESAAQEKNTEYDTSEQHEAAVLADGDAIVGGSYTASGEDQSVLEASGSVTASVTGALLLKTAGDASSADDSSFKGVNACVRVYGDAEVSLTDCTIQADAKNATGVFAYENGVARLDNCTVNVSGGGAGGVQVAGGGTLYGNNLTVTSASKAAIRSDRGGGLMVIDGGSYTSTGSNGCPAIYSTADITVKNADCVSENSRAVIIEGKNSVTLENCTLTGNDQSTKEGSVKANVLLYQSASGDAGEGTSEFSMTGGSIESQSGAMFYCTNTASKIYLSDAELALSEDHSLLIVSAGRWGKDGKNGGDCSFTAENQTLEGSIYVDEISSLALDFTSVHYSGAIQGDGNVSLTMDADSSWVLSGDSHISSLAGDTSGIDLNGYTLYVNGSAFNG
ncbi:MAG: right-handed parallel beta-helix repeat-containing protein [Lachnospiraceae bacterium]|nr:right-handed parallel beta-helix repeat-containing protein [Lachnospiraceae bacterium]